MPRDRFDLHELQSTAKPIIKRRWEPWMKTNISTVYRYAAWLKERGVRYEIRKDLTGQYLIKSEYSGL